jgi:hypothetical protein
MSFLPGRLAFKTRRKILPLATVDFERIDYSYQA